MTDPIPGRPEEPLHSAKNRKNKGEEMFRVAVSSIMKARALSGLEKVTFMTFRALLARNSIRNQTSLRIKPDRQKP